MGSNIFHSMVFLLILLVIETATAVKHGTIGYGINMFHPYCCYACSDSLAMVYLNCTTFDMSDNGDGMSMRKLKKRSMDMGMTGHTSEECHAGNKPYQESFAFCVKSHCDQEQIPYEQQNTCFQSLNSAGVEGLSLEQSLPQVAPVEQLTEDAEWLNSTMLVNEAYWSADRGTLEEFERVEDDHVTWSIAILIISVAVPLLTGLYLFVNSRLPLSRRNGGLTFNFHSYIAVPALGSKRHAQALPWKIGYLPSRSMTLWVTLYIILNVLASALPYKSVQPNSWYTNRNQEIAAYVANRTGVLSFANMALAILFSGRNNPLLFVSGWSQTTQLIFHRWASRVAILQAVIHSIVYTADYMYYKDSNMLATEAAMPYWWWGIIGTTAMGLMVGFSALPLRAYAYELFLIIHIVLAIVSLLGCWYHVDIRFTKNWGYEVWLYIAFAFWAYDRVVRVLKTVFNSLTKKPTARLEAIKDTNAVMMTIRLSKPMPVGPGKHTYVHFPSMTKFWESHPFTICDWDDQTGAIPSQSSCASSSGSEKSSSGDNVSSDGKNETSIVSKRLHNPPDGHYIRCVFRAHSGMTSLVRSKTSPETVLNLPIAVEGVYGGNRSSHWALDTAETVLCIAGGIGITYAAGFARQYARDSLRAARGKKLMPRCREFRLVWSVREENLLTHCRRYILPDLSEVDDGSMRYRFWLTGNSASHPSNNGKQVAATNDVDELVRQMDGRMNVRDVVEEVMAPEKRIVVLVCGPGSLSDEVRAEVTRCSREGYIVDLIEESFTW